ncbi:MAG: response regulator transcription factor [Aerococcus sp.]|nr:response regulator transcription factor [Aerococcus sp.]
MKRVLVVDDEAAILKLLAFNLKKDGYAVTTASDGKTAYTLAKESHYDFIVLDLMLPKLDGMEVCRQLRQDGIETPILILTAKDDEVDKILGLELGADDYMTKPFSPRELTARMKAIFRRTEKMVSAPEIEPTATEDSDVEGERIEVGDIVIDTGAFSVTVRQQVIEMTPKELELLTYMAKRVGRTLSRERLLQKIWDFSYTAETRIVDVHISHLREKIEQDPKHPEYIITVRGFGYKFEVPSA